MAKRRSQRAKINRTGFKQVIISLGVLFSAILFMIKITMGSVGWFEVFAPVLIAFFILFLLSALKAILKKV